MSDNTEESSRSASCCQCEVSDDEDQYDSCCSDVERLKTSNDCNENDTETAKVTLVGDIEPQPSTSNECDTEDSDYMPPEHLASDDSDTAGLYNVTCGSDENSNDVSKKPSYQRVEELSDSDSSSDDDEDPSEALIQARRPHSSGNNTDSSGDDGASYLNTGTVKVKHNLFTAYQRREFGDFGMKSNLTNYTPRMMSSVSFVKRLECVKRLDQHEGCVNALSFNQSGNWLVSGSDDLKAIIWDMNTYKPYLNFDTGHRSNVFQTKFMPFSNDSQVVTCARDGQVRLSELSTTGSCRGSKKLASHKGSAHKLALDYDAPHCLLSAGEDGAVFQIDLRESKPNKILQVKTNRQKLPLHAIDKNPCRSNEFLVSGKDHYIRIYDKRKLIDADGDDCVVKKYHPHRFGTSSPFRRDVTCSVYSYDGSEILGTYNDDDIFLFDNEHSDGADSIRVYTGHRNSATVKGVNFFGPKSEYIVSGSDCGNVYLWDKESTKVLQIQKGDDGGVVNVLEPHPHYPYLAVSGLDNDIKLFMPVAEAAADLTNKAMLMKRNVTERDTRHPEEIDGQMLWYIMQQLQQARRRRQREAAGQLNGDESDLSSLTSDDSSDDDDDGQRGQDVLHTASCVTS